MQQAWQAALAQRKPSSDDNGDSTENGHPDGGGTDRGSN